MYSAWSFTLRPSWNARVNAEIAVLEMMLGGIFAFLTPYLPAIIDRYHSLWLTNGAIVVGACIAGVIWRWGREKLKHNGGCGFEYPLAFAIGYFLTQKIFFLVAGIIPLFW